MNRSNPLSETALRIGQIAEIAAAPVETLKSRLRAGLLAQDEDSAARPAWRFFTPMEAAQIALHHEIKALTGDDGLALAVIMEMAPAIGEAFDGLDADDPEALIWAFSGDWTCVASRTTGGDWRLESGFSHFTSDDAIRRRWAETVEGSPVFSVVNVGAILRRVAARLAALRRKVVPIEAARGASS